MKEATDPLADPNDRFHGWSYRARVRIDHAARELNRAKAERAAAFPDEDQDSLIWALERVEAEPPPIRNPRP